MELYSIELAALSAMNDTQRYALYGTEFAVFVVYCLFTTVSSKGQDGWKSTIDVTECILASASKHNDKPPQHVLHLLFSHGEGSCTQVLAVVDQCALRARQWQECKTCNCLLKLLVKSLDKKQECQIINQMSFSTLMRYFNIAYASADTSEWKEFYRCLTSKKLYCLFMQLSSSHECQFCADFRNQFPNGLVEQALINIMYQYPSVVNITSDPWWLLLTNEESSNTGVSEFTFPDEDGTLLLFLLDSCKEEHIRLEVIKIILATSNRQIREVQPSMCDKNQKLWIILRYILNDQNSSLWYHFCESFTKVCEQYDEVNGNWKCNGYFQMVDIYLHEIQLSKQDCSLNNLNVKNIMRLKRKLLSELYKSYFNNKVINYNSDVTSLLLELLEHNKDTYLSINFIQFWETLATNDHNYRLILQTIIPKLLSEELRNVGSNYQPPKKAISLKMSRKRNSNAASANESGCTKDQYCTSIVQAIMNHDKLWSIIYRDALKKGNYEMLTDIATSKSEVILLVTAMARLSLAQYHQYLDIQSRTCYYWKFKSQQNIVTFIDDNLILCRRFLRYVSESSEFYSSFALVCLLLINEKANLFFHYLDNELIRSNYSKMEITSSNLLLLHAWLIQSRSQIIRIDSTGHHLHFIKCGSAHCRKDIVENLCNLLLRCVNTFSLCSYIGLIATLDSQHNDLMSYIIINVEPLTDDSTGLDNSFINYFPSLSCDQSNIKYIDRLRCTEEDKVKSEPYSFAIVRSCYLALNNLTQEIMQRDHLTESADSNRLASDSFQIVDQCLIVSWKITAKFCAKFTTCVEMEQNQIPEKIATNLKMLILSILLEFLTLDGLSCKKFKKLCKNVIIQESSSLQDSSHEISSISKSLLVIANFVTKRFFKDRPGGGFYY
ncbi:uncharacterized protein TRIADDRAFT_56948 [Trichoplax adhaerens]|uniref:Uncharacterized protein n=1 Tax=Trichoplax adhaerens TaxID=10228 RepID=B3RX04_TRIAD|nr:predicted protein [Trichoplax adhaerens]EDV24784.1 predicted protein [Trichoplax adhaerens]|eukprot:XP_002112674.1 predicted protein [Trichoplax adhaerens]